MISEVLFVGVVLIACAVAVWIASRSGDFKRDIFKAKSGNWTRHQAVVVSTRWQIVETADAPNIRCFVHYSYSVTGIEGQGDYVFDDAVSVKEAEQYWAITTPGQLFQSVMTLITPRFQSQMSMR
jgi:hypothetical protein